MGGGACRVGEGVKAAICGISYFTRNKYSTMPKVTQLYKRRKMESPKQTAQIPSLRKPTHTTPATSHIHRSLIRFSISLTVTQLIYFHVCCYVHQLLFLLSSLTTVHFFLFHVGELARAQEIILLPPRGMTKPRMSKGRRQGTKYYALSK